MSSDLSPKTIQKHVDEFRTIVKESRKLPLSAFFRERAF